MFDQKRIVGGLWYLLQTALVVLVYFGLARLGQVTAIDPGNVSPIWPASGMALAVALYRGDRVAPAIWLGSLLGNTWAFGDFSTPVMSIVTLATGGMIGLGATVQACAGAYLLRRFCPDGAPFTQLRYVYVFVGTQALACLISSTIGVLSLCLAGFVAWSQFDYTWLTWYSGDALGVMLVTPVLMTGNALVPLLRQPLRLLEFLILTVANLAAAAAVFIDFSPLTEPHNPLAILSLPLILWAAIRFENFGVSFLVLCACSVAVFGTFGGHGPFVTEFENVSLMLLQTFLGISALTGLILSTSLSERSESERRLRRAEARMDQAFQAGNVGVWDWDVTTNEVFYSDQFKAQLGYAPDDEFDDYFDWEGRLHPDDREAAVARVRDYFEQRSAEYISTFRMRHKDDTYRWILSRGRAERDELGRPQRVIGVHVDITERKLHADELERSNLELQQFAYAASHDLQEPLRSITSFTQLLERKHGGQFDKESQVWFAAVVSAAKRMRSLIEDLLRFTRLDDRSLPFQMTDLGQVVGDVLANLRSSIDESGAHVTYDQDLPTVMADSTQFVQLFQNLVANALKFRGDSPPVVHISARRKTDEWLLCVKDNGIGIDPKYYGRIFEVFKRLHHRREHPGNGMGLAICRRVVHRHGGNIWVESKSGEGSTFCFTLPFDPGDPTTHG